MPTDPIVPSADPTPDPPIVPPMDPVIPVVPPPPVLSPDHAWNFNFQGSSSDLTKIADDYGDDLSDAVALVQWTIAKTAIEAWLSSNPSATLWVRARGVSGTSESPEFSLDIQAVG